MKKWIAIAAAASLVAACGQGTNTETTTASAAAEAAPAVKEVHSGVLVDNMDTTVRPGDDFNEFVNGGWMATAEIPADRASNSVGLQVHEEATENVRLIIEESAEGDFAKGTDEQKVGDLYVSYMDMDTRNALGVTPLEQEFNNINSLANHTDLAVYFAEVNKLGVGTPFVLAQYVDFKNPNTYMMYTFQAGLGLPDREYYFDDSDRGLDIRPGRHPT